MSYPSGRNLTDFEQQVILKWRTVPNELWSKPDLYKEPNGTIPNRIISAVQNKGLQSLGFSKEKVFDYCHSTLQNKVPVEEKHIENVLSIIDLLRKNGGEINHYCKDAHIVKTFRIEDYSNYGNLHAYSEFHSRLIKFTGGVSFAVHESKFQSSMSFAGHRWAVSNVNFKNLDIYPELDSYLAHSEILNKINLNLSKIADALPVLFQIGKEQLNKITIKPCLISNGERCFYLHHFSGASQYGLLLNYEGITTWTI